MIVPAVAAPVIAGIVAACGTWLVYRITRNVMAKRREDGFRWGQIATASLVALSHGTNDAQKTMGVIALALITTGHLTGDVKKNGLPFWIIFSCALAIGLGTYIGGWRVIRTLGKGLVEIESPQGLAAEASSAAIILSSSAAGMALSTTHVATGSILGSGVGKPGAEVRWGVAGRMAVAWLVTLPAAALVGALACWLSNGVESLTGSALAGDGLIFLVLCALSGYVWWRAQQQKVDSNNVNADWDSSTNSVVPADVREASKAAAAQGLGLIALTPDNKGNVDDLRGKLLQVLVVGLVLGAGLPAVFAAGLVAFSNGAGGANSDGTVAAPNPVSEVPRAAAVRSRRLVILTAILWITRTTIIHHFGFDPFPGVKKAEHT